MTRQRNGSESAPVPVYILAGGRSRRFGSDKARAVIDGVPLLVRVASCFREVATRVTVVARNRGAYADLGLRTIGDIVADAGPLGGLLTAIDDHRHNGWVFVTACDWVGLRSEWVFPLLGGRGGNGRAVLFESNRDQPLFGLYHTSIRGVIEARIEAGRLEMLGLLDEIGVITVRAPSGWGEARNLNRPAA